jgi:hypothetical protein
VRACHSGAAASPARHASELGHGRGIQPRSRAGTSGLSGVNPPGERPAPRSIDSSVIHGMQAVNCRRPYPTSSRMSAASNSAQGISSMPAGREITSDPARPPVYGCYAGRALAVAGMLEPWGDRLLHVGIVTHPPTAAAATAPRWSAERPPTGSRKAAWCSTGRRRPTSRWWRSPASSASSASPIPLPSGLPLREPMPAAQSSSVPRTGTQPGVQEAD